MKSSDDSTDAEYDWSLIMETHEVMYLVKRPAYEFCFAIPRRQEACMDQERPVLKMRFKEPCQVAELVLEIEEVKDLFDGLSRLIEYVRTEETKRDKRL
jgi:hypothetical protein